MPEWQISDLKDFLEVVLKDYPIPEETFAHKAGQEDSDVGEDLRVGREDLEAYRNLIKDDGVRVVDNALEDDLNLLAPKNANLAHIPYVAVLDSTETKSTQYGRYIVYLVDPYADKAYLTLNIGATKTAEDFAQRLRQLDDIPSTRSQDEILRWLAHWYRGESTPPSNFDPGPIEFNDSLARSGPYGNGTIYYREYTLDQLPSNADLVEDLNELVETYQDLLDRKVSNIDTNIDKKSVWHVSDGQKRWEGWSENGVASIGYRLDPNKFESDPRKLETIDDTNKKRSEGQGYAFLFTQSISEDDIILAAARGKKSPHQIYAVGRVTDTALDPDRTDLHESIEDDNEFVGVDWAEFDTTVPITLGKHIPLTDKTICEVDQEGFQHVLGTTFAHAVAGGLYSSVADATRHITERTTLDIDVEKDSSIDHPAGESSGGVDMEDTEGRTEDDDPSDTKSWKLSESDQIQPDFQLEPDQVDLNGLYFENEEELLTEVLDALRRGDHLLFVGPPGTGKSKLARELADELVDDEYEMTTATADWSTFDTIGGYRQQRDKNLEFVPGLFLSRFQDEDGQPTNEWLIVDEFNRANIDKAFGSLFSVLAKDDVVLPFTDQNDRDITVYGSELDPSTTVYSNEYVVPSEWRLLATMNTFDKSSLYDLSYALSRRFAYIHVPSPSKEDIDRDLVESYVGCWDGIEPNDTELEAVVDLWETIQNERPLGPAIIRDVLDAAGSDLTPGVTQHVLPQFDGLMNSTQRDLLTGIARTDLVDAETLELFGEQYFELQGLEL